MVTLCLYHTNPGAGGYLFSIYRYRYRYVTMLYSPEECEVAHDAYPRGVHGNQQHGLLHVPRHLLVRLHLAHQDPDLTPWVARPGGPPGRAEEEKNKKRRRREEMRGEVRREDEDKEKRSLGQSDIVS